MKKSKYEIIAIGLMAALREPTNTEKVFAELMEMRDVKKEFTLKEIRERIKQNHQSISKEYLSKIMAELKSYNLLIKKYNHYILNFN